MMISSIFPGVRRTRSLSHGVAQVRALMVGATLLGLYAVEVVAADIPKTADELVRQTQEAFGKAKSDKERQSIAMWCKDMVTTFSFRRRDKLSVEAINLMRSGHLDEANALLKQVKSIEDLDETLGAWICKPR